MPNFCGPLLVTQFPAVTLRVWETVTRCAAYLQGQKYVGQRRDWLRIASQLVYCRISYVIIPVRYMILYLKFVFVYFGCGDAFRCQPLHVMPTKGQSTLFCPFAGISCKGWYNRTETRR
jgi:hypothetical protein